MESGQQARRMGRFLGMVRKNNYVTVYLAIVDPIVKRGEKAQRMVFNKRENFFDKAADELEERNYPVGMPLAFVGDLMDIVTTDERDKKVHGFKWKGGCRVTPIPDEECKSMFGGKLPSDEETTAAHKFFTEKSNGGGNSQPSGGGFSDGGSW